MVLVLKRLRRRGNGLKSHPTDWEKPGIEPATLFCGFPGYKPVPPRWFKIVCWFYVGNTQRLTESGFMEKPGIEPATPGLQDIGLSLHHGGILYCYCIKQLLKENIILYRCSFLMMHFREINIKRSKSVKMVKEIKDFNKFIFSFCRLNIRHLCNNDFDFLCGHCVGKPTLDPRFTDRV